MLFHEPTGDLYILSVASSRMLLVYSVLTEAIDAWNNANGKEGTRDIACKLYHQKVWAFFYFPNTSGNLVKPLHLVFLNIIYELKQTFQRWI